MSGSESVSSKLSKVSRQAFIVAVCDFAAKQLMEKHRDQNAYSETDDNRF